jgi:uncharacterized membrane protein YfcA
VTELLAVLVGVLAGILAGVFGVGGGIVFVPALVAIGLEEHQAIGTSLLAILPVVAAGTWKNMRAGAVRWRSAALIGVAAVVSAQGGVVAAEALPAHVLRKLFAALLVVVAVQIAVRARAHDRAR